MRSEAVCGHCGAAYVPKTAQQRWCSPACRYTARDRARGHLATGSVLTEVCSDCQQEFSYVLHKKHRIRCVPCADELAHREKPEW
jgi:hypothetical protein